MLIQLSEKETSAEVFGRITSQVQEAAHGSKKDALEPGGNVKPRPLGNVNVNADTAKETKGINSSTAFNEIVPQAFQARQDAGRMRAGGFKMKDSGKVEYSHQKYIVKPSLTDFVVDVEGVARKTLSEVEFGYFKRVYLIGCLSVANAHDPLDLTPDGRDKYFTAHLENYPVDQREAIAVFDRNLREKLGAAFIANGIYPFNMYMNYTKQDMRVAAETRSN